MPFVDQPGYVYTDPVDWHPDPYYVSHGPSGGGTHNHTPDFFSDTGGPVRLHESCTANGSFSESFGGPHPGEDAAQCVWDHVETGHNLDGGFWNEVCPDPPSDPSTTFGVHRSSTGSSNFTALPTSGAQSAGADARISGWTIRPWLFRLWDTPYADDEALEDEYVAATNAGWPGPGWFLEVERNYPFFVKFQVAPDEVVSTSGQTRTDPVRWFHGPFLSPEEGDAWAFTGLNPADIAQGVWTYGDNPSGVTLAEYSGGLADWLDVPEEWLPEQDLTSQFFTDWLDVPATDEEIAAATIPLTLAAETVYDGNFPSNTTKGRTGQWLMVRAEYRLPQIRWYREITTIPPRRLRQRSDGETHGARRVLGGGNTVQSGSRVLGGIL